MRNDHKSDVGIDRVLKSGLIANWLKETDRESNVGNDRKSDVGIDRLLKVVTDRKLNARTDRESVMLRLIVSQVYEQIMDQMSELIVNEISEHVHMNRMSGNDSGAMRNREFDV